MVRNLRGRVNGGEIETIIVHRQNGKYLPGKEKEQLLFDNINGLRRRGKFMVFETMKGLLVCHNAMSGYWDTADNPWTFDYVEGKRETTEKDMRVSLHLSDGTALCFHDARLFGSLRFYPGAREEREVRSLRDLGPDALGEDWFPSTLIEACQSRESKTIKEVLMDQEAVAGIGNIYAAEALFKAKIRPDRKSMSLSADEFGELHHCCRYVMRAALDRELNYDGLLVYRRKDCAVCGGPISKIEIAKRGTYFCPNCQK